MVKLPVVSGPQLVKALEKDGFKVVRTKGSHAKPQKGKLRTIVPLHEELDKGTLHGILEQCGMSKDDLMRLL